MARNPFSAREDKHLAEYIATHNPRPEGRRGKKLYQDLVKDVTTHSWSKTHSWQSWRDRYVKNNDGSLDRAINRYLIAAKAKPNQSPSSSPSRVANDPANIQAGPSKTEPDVKHTAANASSSETAHLPPPKQPSLYPDLSGLAGPSNAVHAPAQPKPKLRKRQPTPDRDSGFFESSPSAPQSPAAPPRKLPRIEKGTFRTTLASSRKRAASSDGESENVWPPVRRRKRSREAAESNTSPIVQDPPPRTDNIRIERTVSVSPPKPMPHISDFTSATPTPAPFTMYPLADNNKPGQSSKSTPSLPTHKRSSSAYSDPDDPFQTHHRHRRYTLGAAPIPSSELPHIDLKAERRKSRSSMPAPEKMIERGISVWVSEMAEKYTLSKAFVRRTWDTLADEEEAEKVFVASRDNQERALSTSAMGSRRRSSASSKASRLEISPLKNGVEVEGEYQPPSESRAAQMVRRSRKGKERDVSYSRQSLKGLNRSPSIMLETPSPPQRFQRKWGDAEDDVLRRLGPGDMAEARALEVEFGYDFISDRVEEILLASLGPS